MRVNKRHKNSFFFWLCVVGCESAKRYILFALVKLQTKSREREREKSHKRYVSYHKFVLTRLDCFCKYFFSLFPSSMESFIAGWEKIAYHKNAMAVSVSHSPFQSHISLSYLHVSIFGCAKIWLCPLIQSLESTTIMWMKKNEEEKHKNTIANDK